MYYIFFICAHGKEELAKFLENLNNLIPNLKFTRSLMKIVSHF